MVPSAPFAALLISLSRRRVTGYGLPGTASCSVGHCSHSLGSGTTHTTRSLPRNSRLLQLANSWMAAHGGLQVHAPTQCSPTQQTAAQAAHMSPPNSTYFLHRGCATTVLQDSLSLKHTLDPVIPLLKHAVLLTLRESLTWLCSWLNLPSHLCTMCHWPAHSGSAE